MPAQRVFIFDLDNTLHNASAHVFPQLNESMTRYIREHLRLDEARANHLRLDYWRRYGATLCGLMRHHGTDPHHFLRETHQFDDLEASLITDPILLRALCKLQRRKLLFSNAPRHYVEAVLQALGIRHVFDVIHCIEDTGFQPKPHLHGFRRLLGRARLDPRRCVFVDDSSENLRAAKQLRMYTVRIGAERDQHDAVDAWVRNPRQLAAFLSSS